MEWLRRPDNRFFSRAFVNRAWAAYFNVRIVDPPDDLSLANPPSNKPLLDYLTKVPDKAILPGKGIHRKRLRHEVVASDDHEQSRVSAVMGAE